MDYPDAFFTGVIVTPERGKNNVHMRRYGHYGFPVSLHLRSVAEAVGEERRGAGARASMRGCAAGVTSAAHCRSLRDPTVCNQAGRAGVH